MMTAAEIFGDSAAIGPADVPEGWSVREAATGASAPDGWVLLGRDGVLVVRRTKDGVSQSGPAPGRYILTREGG